MAVNREGFRRGRLGARPGGPGDRTKASPGRSKLNLNSTKEPLLYVPRRYDPARPAPLALMLHGAGGGAEQGLSILQEVADKRNLLLLAPASKDYSWDIIAREAFGTDVLLIDSALELVFSRFAVDPAHVLIGGFSDGASYALSLGLGNGDLFTHVLAFSPGFYHTEAFAGKPQLFLSHGSRDRILPIEPCSRRIVSRLRAQGIYPEYHEFEGGHEIPASIRTAALCWFA